MVGGYDDGYSQSKCFWGMTPGKLVTQLMSTIGPVAGLRVLDAGCGEGKNAGYLAAGGAFVRAIDVSELAIAHARQLFDPTLSVRWEVGNIVDADLSKEAYDIVLAYGLLHCLSCKRIVISTVLKIQACTKVGGYNAVVAFNDRQQDLTAHPGFSPCLLAHSAYVTMYDGWDILHSSDSDLTERHPHNDIEHTHSMTRVLARKVSL
jgi:SAM-dependent methyltransferase